jgi:glycosyltransferase involved in cell wall biosynthesis
MSVKKPSEFVIAASVIVPTYGRPVYLRDTLVSILQQESLPGQYEIIVVDNKPTGEVHEMVQGLEQESHRSIGYVEETNVGLHNARHAGAREALREILVYVDDDVIATPGWLKAILNVFTNQEVALVGGKILPKWEGDIPDWINLFKSELEYGWTIGYLSLLDFGSIRKEIPARFVYGCNYSIRKSILSEFGGFHPDSFPQELIQYRGDGETALSLAIEEEGYGVVYEPKATVYHRIPRERLTVEYFCQRAFNQGVSDSYSEIRREHGLGNVVPQLHQRNTPLSRDFRKVLRMLMFWKDKATAKEHPVIRQIAGAYEEGKSFHRSQVSEDPKLLEYVLQENYF